MTPMNWKHAIVVGASSGIGAEIARQLGAAGCRVALVARRTAELERVAAQIDGAAPGAPRTLIAAHDVTVHDDAPALLARLAGELGGLDLVVYAAGVMPAVREDEYSF